MSALSPFSRATIVTHTDGDKIIQSTTPTFFAPSRIIHTVVEGENLPAIAYKYYGDSGLWANIAIYNNILNPFTEPIPGQRIIIP